MIAMWESDISATFLVFRLKCSTDGAFLSFLACYSLTGPRCKRSYVLKKLVLGLDRVSIPSEFLKLLAE